ncbi:MAG: twin-arginine translocase TatA/TatE family subunit [Ignavibacteriae bacterium]|nr:twin-arginine translocase TatA/TatE family subunit [Ignavibacteriota bacterium]MCB9216664.1 twin-arginine translocase TatA/TatE family subunit [Ignavibacteria bacterium]
MYAFFAPGPTEIILIILGVLLLFGGKKIPELMKGLGSGMREFKKASSLDDPDDNKRESARIENNQS